MPDWKRIAELTDERRAAARDAKALMVGAIRDGCQPTDEEQRRLEELGTRARQVDTDLERAFYDDPPGN